MITHLDKHLYFLEKRVVRNSVMGSGYPILSNRFSISSDLVPIFPISRNDGDKNYKIGYKMKLSHLSCKLNNQKKLLS